MDTKQEDSHVLLVAATDMEVKLLTEECTLIDARADNLRRYALDGFHFDLLITGIGTAFTTFFLTHHLSANNCPMVINVGLAGSLTDHFKIGDVVNVTEEEFADLGIEKENEFLTLFDSGFLHPDEFPFENRMLKADGHGLAGFLPGVKGITSNISHGCETSIVKLKNRFSASVESMEGAAVFFVCRWYGVPCLQIRAISNMVAPRSLSRWDIPLALENLRNAVLKVLRELPDKVG
ncbi:MAG: futalosine hydrolase [Prolixibacteraceae bacterium]|mgnify:CR=1 FL=1|jgi:futalosine hydrolase|nr:futalosine hydrolase [Prolixibacteraceae bacterium]MDI9563527.1 futalosine hydrolase [Bacteroidota bacterium]NLS99019.1 futalosine hydrolase [Bacteroidales bacterium]OQB80865.1 MAG: Futalosine hydrolase [Bacteroidetes bacterium ADurb.Bin123]HNZ68202.1 futalosine hydrolase [Prolixibacteraceae bacterium]